jgi:hypothetical protein
MNTDLAKPIFTDHSQQLSVILSILQRLQDELHIAKCEIKTSVRDVARNQEYLNDSLIKLRIGFREIDERLHGLELRYDRQNSST